MFEGRATPRRLSEMTDIDDDDDENEKQKQKKNVHFTTRRDVCVRLTAA